jgi:hypothetical protein
MKSNTLRYYAKARILNDMIASTKKRALYDKNYIILVMDASALKVFSSCCKMFEVYGSGLYHIERLEKKRKKFPTTDVIYFISPNKSSIQRLLDDFPAEKVEKEADGGALKNVVGGVGNVVGKLGLDAPLLNKENKKT